MKRDEREDLLTFGFLTIAAAVTVVAVKWCWQRMEHNRAWHTIKTERARNTNRARVQSAAKGKRWPDHRVQHDHSFTVRSNP